MQIVIDVPEKYYKDAKRMVWSSTYSGSLISGWLRNAIPVREKDGYFVTDDYDLDTAEELWIKLTDKEETKHNVFKEDSDD